MKAILALDQGTTSSRALLFDRAGRVLASAQREFRQYFPEPGWVEHDAMEIWQSQREVAAQALRQSGLVAADVAAVGITNQRETTVLWDRATGTPLAPAIVWQDRRTADFCEQLKATGYEETIRNKTGLVIDAYFSGTKLKWLLDHLPGARDRAARGELAFGTIDSWLIWHLTGGRTHVSDVSNASRTMLLNMHTLDWDDELLTLMDIPREVLPRVVASSERLGVTDCADLPHGLVIAGVAGDQQAALFGQACHRPGMVKNTYGTGCFMLMNTGEKPVLSQNRLLTTVAWRLGEEAAGRAGGQTHYALEGSVFMAGALVQWLRDGLGMIKQAAEIEALAASVPHTEGVYLVPAFTGLGAPYWDPHARGMLLGLTRGVGRAHIARAALEAIAFQSTELATAMSADAAMALQGCRVDGGASANNLLMQIQADLLGLPVVRPQVTETTALGAAYLAGLATGFWKSLDEISELWAHERTFTPTLSQAEGALRLRTWQRAVERCKAWAHG